MRGKAGDQKRHDKWYYNESGERHIKCWWCKEPIGQKGSSPAFKLPDGRYSHERCKPRRDDPIWKGV